MKRFKLGIIPFAGLILLFFAAVAGWMMNLVKFIGMLGDPVTSMLIARLAGIPLGPLGAILGYL